MFAKLAVADRSASMASENIDAMNAVAPRFAVMVEKNGSASPATVLPSAIMVSEKIYAETAGAHPYAYMEGGEVCAKSVVVRLCVFTGKSSIVAQSKYAHSSLQMATSASPGPDLWGEELFKQPLDKTLLTK